MEFGPETEEDKPPSYDDVAGDEANVGVTTEVGEESVIYQVSQNNSRQGGRKQSNIGRSYRWEKIVTFES